MLTPILYDGTPGARVQADCGIGYRTIYFGPMGQEAIDAAAVALKRGADVNTEFYPTSLAMAVPGRPLRSLREAVS